MSWFGSEKPAPGAAPRSVSQSSLKKDAVWRAVTCGVDGDVESVLKDVRGDKDEFVNMVRNVTKEELKNIGNEYEYQMGEYSVLFVAICRGMHSDVKYLLQQPNISLATTCGQEMRTPLFEAVLRKSYDMVLQILRCPSVSPSQYINIGDFRGDTPLHRVAINCDKGSKIASKDAETDQDTDNIRILRELLKRGVNIDALNHIFRTPLHTLTSVYLGNETIQCVKLLLDAGAEVNTKDEYGDSPLHEACISGDHELIRMLLECGADLDTRNLDWKTAQDLFYEHRNPPSKEDYEFAAKEFARLKKTAAARRRVGNIPQQINPPTEEMRAICSEFPVYVRYQWAGWNAKADGSNSMAWVRTDLKVSQVLYPHDDDNPRHHDPISGGQGFLTDSKKQFLYKVQDCLEEEEQEQELTTRPQAIEEREGPLNRPRDLEQAIDRGAWRWINFPSNNMTWMKDFVIHNARRLDSNEVDKRTWQFFERSIQVHETNTSYTRVRIPHVQVGQNRDAARAAPKSKREPDSMSIRSQESGKPRGLTSKEEERRDNDDSKAKSWSNVDSFRGSGKLLSLVIPFIDIETEDQPQTEFGQLTQSWRIKKLNQTYFPFTGMHGVQPAQTLDQTSYNTNDDSVDPSTDLHSVENQVIYRWSKKRTDTRKEDEARLNLQEEELEELKTLQKRERPSWKRNESHISRTESAETKAPAAPLGLWKRLWAFLFRPLEEELHPPPITQQTSFHDTVDPIRQERAGRRGASAPNAARIRQDPTPKWLMVRQVWLWKLDNNTVLTAIPSRQNGMIADTLLETIRQGNLDVLQSTEDLIKRIIYDAVTFLDEFKWAGLGEHILDIFDQEIAVETYQEAKFFQRFSQSTWSPAMVNESIQEAAQSIYRVKDLRDELRLIRQVLETQLKVITDFAEAFWPPNARVRSKGETMTAKALGESFIRDCGLQSMIARVKDMDEDASTTLQGLSNIIQAMQAQASLKEAEASRVMNLIILPFTIVTVIFTPLSFLTGLFAVNLMDFPHNEEGELRLPGSWFYWRMAVGEIVSLLVVFIFVYHLYNRERAASGAKTTIRKGTGLLHSLSLWSTAREPRET